MGYTLAVMVTLAVVLRGLRASVQLLTRIPLPVSREETFDGTWASAFFPLVGAGVGAFSSAIYAGSERTGALVAATLAVAGALLLTGALHEDGLADTADAFGAHSRERFFEILKDSRIGTFGASALVVALLLRVGLIARLGPGGLGALVFAESASRLSPALLLSTLPYVTPGAVAKHTGFSGGTPQVVVATLGVLGIAGVLTAVDAVEPVECAVAFASTLLSTLACGRTFSRRAGGVTGDLLGAAQQLSVVVALAAFAFARGSAP